MKSKNLVSLFVSLIFLVLSVTGLLIYFAQGGHTVDHIHAWFGFMFVAAAVFHIVNNWSSIVGYTRDRRTGGIRKEFYLPVLVAIVFTVGIAADFPVFDKLANGGKMIFGKKKSPKDGPLSQSAVDSIARSTETQYAKAYTSGDTTALSAVLAPKASIWTEEGGATSGKAGVKSASLLVQNEVEQARIIDDNVIVVHGTLMNAAKTESAIYTHVLKRQDDKWQIAAIQMARPSAKSTERTASN